MSESLERNPPSGIRISDSGSASEMYPASASSISIGMVAMAGMAGMLGRVRPVGTFRMGRSGWLGRRAVGTFGTGWPEASGFHGRGSHDHCYKLGQQVNQRIFWILADEETFVDMARSNALFHRSNLMNYARTSRSGPKRQNPYESERRQLHMLCQRACRPDCYMHLGDVNLELATLDWIQCLVSSPVA